MIIATLSNPKTIEFYFIFLHFSRIAIEASLIIDLVRNYDAIARVSDEENEEMRMFMATII